MKIIRVEVSAFFGEMQVKPFTQNPELEDLEPNVDDVEKVKQQVSGKLRVYHWPKSQKGTGFTKTGSENPTKYSLAIK